LPSGLNAIFPVMCSCSAGSRSRTLPVRASHTFTSFAPPATTSVPSRLYTGLEGGDLARGRVAQRQLGHAALEQLSQHSPDERRLVVLRRLDGGGHLLDVLLLDSQPGQGDLLPVAAERAAEDQADEVAAGEQLPSCPVRSS
jgi:hypothetical protein